MKLAFDTDGGEREHVWAEVLDVSGDVITARIVTPPVTHRGSLPERIDLPLADLEDWQVFLPDGRIRGGFSTQAMAAACERDGRPVPRALRGVVFVDAEPFPPAPSLVRG